MDTLAGLESPQGASAAQPGRANFPVDGFALVGQNRGAPITGQSQSRGCKLDRKGQKMKVQRTGQRPLEFEGQKIASASSRNHAGKERNRWHEITVWKTASGKFVAAVSYLTQWEGEASHDDALAFDSLEQVATLLEEYIFPNIAAIGFPASPTYADRQARMMADLEEGFKHAAGQVLEELDATEKI
jgi:hypothetical protein